MGNLTVTRNTLRQGDQTLVALPAFPMKAAKLAYEGCMVALTAGGFLVDAGDGAAVTVIGVADVDVDNSAGADGALMCPVRRGCHKFDNDATHPIVQGSLYLTTGKATDNHTVVLAAGTGPALSGRFLQLDSDGVWVEFF